MGRGELPSSLSRFGGGTILGNVFIWLHLLGGLFFPVSLVKHTILVKLCSQMQMYLL